MTQGKNCAVHRLLLLSFSILMSLLLIAQWKAIEIKLYIFPNLIIMYMGLDVLFVSSLSMFSLLCVAWKHRCSHSTTNLA